MNEDCLKLTTYGGERDRTRDAFVADALLDIYGRRQLQASVLLRGIEGFGHHHQLHTQRLLTLSEDLPLVSLAVDTRDRIEAALPEVIQVKRKGFVTLERARLLTGEIDAVELPLELHAATKLTIYVGRHERAGDRPAFVALIDLLHRSGVAGATAFLGVDGTAHGVRQRAKFFGRNAAVPMVIVSVGDGHAIAQLLPKVGDMLERPLLTLERVTVCKRDGDLLARPPARAETDLPGREMWQKLTIYAGEQAKHNGHPLYVELVRRLRAAGAAGATSVRALWGYHGDHRPHGDKLLSLRRHVPVVTVVVDTPQRIQRWFAIVDEVTGRSGLVTSEFVPMVALMS